MILLGAGASKVFGLKTLQDLTNDLVIQMKDRGHEKTISEIIEALKRYHLSPDFENIYTTLEALANPEEGIKKNGAFTAYIAYKTHFDTAKDPNMVREYESILSDFRNLIYRECTIFKGILENNGSIFDAMFKLTGEYSEQRYLSSIVGTAGYVRVTIGDTIVTTNYDMAVELYHRWKGEAIADGFKSTLNQYTKELDFYEYGRKSSSHWLIKLHGSIWQFKQDNGIIQTIADPKSLPLQISVGEQMMIYPIGEKPILQEPYFSFYRIFKEQPWETLVAIGHSFRDEPINVAILERLNKQPHSTKLIILNPHAEDVAKNLNLPAELDHRIIRINSSFKDDRITLQKINIALNSKNCSQYKHNAMVSLGES